MKKNQKILLGIGAVAVVGYILWKKQQTSFTGVSNKFATVGRRQKNAAGTSKIAPYGVCEGCNVTGCSNPTRNHSAGVCAGTAPNPRTGQVNSTILDCNTCQVIYESNPSQLIPNFPTYSPNIGGFFGLNAKTK